MAPVVVTGSACPSETRQVTKRRETGGAVGIKILGILAGNESDGAFIEALVGVSESGLGYFGAHADLKDAFMKGYRIGYQDRTADLVLGPYLTAAAGKIGQNSATGFVRVVNLFEESWANQLRNAVNIFVTLISEGSQADRERFMQSFVSPYDDKYQKTQDDLKSGGCVMQTSEGGRPCASMPARPKRFLTFLPHPF